ncbi:MAG TPA: ATP-binding protein [Chitinophagaceae bacterium]|jgi:signal transduction histidine kinase|nr:ATP-binding protein [Chitinophagaceae bacterium]
MYGILCGFAGNPVRTAGSFRQTRRRNTACRWLSFCTIHRMSAGQYDEQLFSELFDVQPQAIVWMQPVRSPEDGSLIDFEFTYCNEEALRYLNLTRDQQRGLLLSRSPTLTEELRRKVLEEIKQVYETGKESKTDMYNPVLNKYARVLRTRLRDGVLTVIQERTDEKRIIRQLEEQAVQLQQQKNLLDNILAHSPAGISVTEVIRDASGTVIDGRTLLANDPSLEYIGVSKEEILTKTLRAIDPALFESPLFQLALSTLETGKPIYTQYYFEPAGRWLELSVARLDNDRLINVFMDVTATKEAQLRQQKLVEELQRSNVNLEEFAYAASHDLKEPIRKVLFFADRLKTRLQDRLDEEDRRMFSRLEAANERMGGLVDDLLTYSQVGQRPLYLQDVDLTALIQVILDDLELEIQEKKACIRIDNLATIRGHQRQLQQLFQNLISNALKYSRPGVPPQIAIVCRTQPGSATGLHLSPEEQHQIFYTIEVRDNGIGFEPRDADRIFNVFQRLHGNTEYRGSGVGLAIARKVAQNHNGYIHAESRPGEGSTFTVYLPVG